MLTLLYCLVHLASSQDPCVTPDGQNGACIPITKCKPLLDKLHTEGYTASGYLVQFHCRFESEPIVCCAQNNKPPNPADKANPPDPNVEGRPTGPVFEEKPTGPTVGNKPLGTSPYLLKPPQCGYSPNLSLDKVVGGEPAALGSWPWMALLGYRIDNQQGWRCGGALISKRHVLTAAHCIEPSLFQVRLGELVIDDNGADGAQPIDIPIEKVTSHPGYRGSENDIALIRLARDVQFSDYIQPICLPIDDELRTKDLVNLHPFVAGWGAIRFRGPGSKALLEIQIPIVSEEKCRKAYADISQAIIDERVVCAGYTRGTKDACRGDSGGPLMLPENAYFYTYGVISYGKQCALPGVPGVYSRVTYHLDFILNNLV